MEEFTRIMIRSVENGVLGKWRIFNETNIPPISPPALSGLRLWMKDNPDFGWDPGKLVRVNADHHIWSHTEKGVTEHFWIPDETGFTVIKFRQALDGVGFGDWKDFNTSPKAGPLPSHTPDGLREWMDRNRAYNWDPKKLHRITTDPHFFAHGEGIQFWIPISEGGIFTTVSCVNALGCETLTEGKEYVLRDESVDGLVTVIDDTGTKREFLSERFGPVAMLPED